MTTTIQLFEMGCEHANKASTYYQLSTPEYQFAAAQTYFLAAIGHAVIQMLKLMQGETEDDDGKEEAAAS